MRVRLSQRLNQGGAALIALALLFASPALANPSTASTATPAPSAPATASPAPASADSPIPEPTDAETAAFRAKLAEKQAELDELEAQLDALDRELSIAAEEYNKAVVELEAITNRLETTKKDLANAELAFELQQDTLSERARDIYRNGELSSLDILLGAKSISDFVARVRYLYMMGESDASIVAALEAQRDLIAEAEKDAEADEQQARSLEFQLQARKIEVMLRIQEREELLASVQTELLELLDDQAAERQLAEAELLREVLTGANRAGIVVEPGSPVETALAYHGVPYLWGGESPRGFDCSGLVMYVMRQHGVSLPHYSGAQFQLGERVAPSALQPGDVVFFGSPVYHVGMYVGAGYFIHAPRTGDFVKLSRLADRKDYAGARRYDWHYRTQPIVGAVTDPVAAVR
ncbi:MAG: NlpC/P60 family protein [Coriobacteriia bacterium]|nr:NlpC/P60 family protein [Coriobacteriia bacterium]